MTDIGVDDPLELLDVSASGPGSYRGRCIDGSIGRVFGGHALAQTIVAGALAAGAERDIDAVHVSFVRPASSSDPLDYRADVVKSGRALDVVGVRAEQAGAVMLFGFVTTHVSEPSIEFGVTAPSTPGPADLPRSRFRPPGTNPGVRAPFDLRYITDPESHGAAREQLWLRTEARVRSDRQVDHAALLAYSVDFLVTRAAHVRLPETMPIVGASLDHAMWFHRPFRIDEWLLVTSETSTYAGSRSLSTSQVFDRSGALVASATQEALIRSASSS